jgi:hypothetical protein
MWKYGFIKAMNDTIHPLKPPPAKYIFAQDKQSQKQNKKMIP